MILFVSVPTTRLSCVCFPVTLGSAPAQSSGARTVVVTDTASHDFLTGTDHVLVAATANAHFHWSMVAPVAILEGLVTEVAAVSPEETRRRLETTDEFKKEQGFFLEG